MAPSAARGRAQHRRLDLRFEEHEAGAETYRETGEALPKSTLDAARRADAVLLGAMGLPHIRYPDGTEIAPQLDLRFEFGLYAGVRPIRATPGVPPVLADARAKDIDLVVIRESTEGLFASRGKGVIEDDREGRDTLVITRAVCERLFDFSFRLAESRKRAGGKGRATCVDKGTCSSPSPSSAGSSMSGRRRSPTSCRTTSTSTRPRSCSS